jgi:phage major head subunit gpT-like protein
MLISQQNLSSFFTACKALYNKGFDGTTSYYEKITMTTKSSSREEEYGWLGQFPALREWSGDRVIKNLQAHGFCDQEPEI